VRGGEWCREVSGGEVKEGEVMGEEGKKMSNGTIGLTWLADQK